MAAAILGLLQPSRWKSLRQELLKDLECFLRAVLHGDPLSAPPGGTEALWEALVTCLRGQALLPPAAEGPSHCLPTPTAATGPLLLILDDNFYYRSMRYEVYQLARKCKRGISLHTHSHARARTHTHTHSLIANQPSPCSVRGSWVGGPQGTEFPKLDAPRAACPSPVGALESGRQ